MEDWPFYNELLRRKQVGEVLDFDKIDEGTLRHLWSETSDSFIADLYGVTKEEVTRKRRQLGINKWNTLYPIWLEKAVAKVEPGPQSFSEVAAAAMPNEVGGEQNGLDEVKSTFSYSDVVAFVRGRREATEGIATWAQDVNSFPGLLFNVALVMDGAVASIDPEELLGFETDEEYRIYSLRIMTPDGGFDLTVGEYRFDDETLYSPVFINGDWHAPEEGEEEEPDWSPIDLFWSEPVPNVMYDGVVFESFHALEDLAEEQMEALRKLVIHYATLLGQCNKQVRGIFQA